VTVDFDALANAAQTGDKQAIAALWDSVMRLPQWHFVAVGEFDMESNAPHVFVSTVDNRRMLFVFTDEERARTFAVKHDAKVKTKESDEPGVAVISQPMPAAVQYAEQFAQAGVEAVVFNYGVNTNGFFLPIASVGQAWRHSIATIHNFDELAQQAFTESETQENDIGKLLFFLFSLPEWHFVGDSEFEGAPVRVRMENLQANACAAFTDGARAREAAKTLVKGKPHHGAMPLKEAIEYLERVSEHDVKHVVFNLGTAPFHLQIDRLRPTHEDVIRQRQRLAEAHQQSQQQTG
jgi:hypothetical protein